MRVTIVEKISKRLSITQLVLELQDSMVNLLLRHQSSRKWDILWRSYPIDVNNFDGACPFHKGCLKVYCWTKFSHVLECGNISISLVMFGISAITLLCCNPSNTNFPS